MQFGLGFDFVVVAMCKYASLDVVTPECVKMLMARYAIMEATMHAEL